MKHSDRLTGMVINATDRFVPPEKAEAIVKRLSRKLDKMSLTEIKAELGRAVRYEYPPEAVRAHDDLARVIHDLHGRIALRGSAVEQVFHVETKWLFDEAMQIFTPALAAERERQIWIQMISLVLVSIREESGKETP